MVYVYVDSLRMAYIQNELKANTLSDPDEIKKGDTIIFPVLKKNQRSLQLKKGTLRLSQIEGCILFLPFSYTFVKENNKVYYYMRDDFIIKENAKLTALGLLAYLGSLPISLKDIHFDVIGYGKCGTAIVKLLNAMGYAYTIVRHNEVDAIDEKICSIDQYKRSKKGAIIINTAPYHTLTKDDFANDEVKYLIDISSERCFKESDVPKQCNLLYPGSLPNQYFAYSSAALIADYVKGKENEK